MTIEKNLTPSMVLTSGRIPKTEKGIRLTWTGNSITFRFRGSAASLICGDKPSGMDTVYVSLQVDDLPPRRIPITEDRAIISTGDLRQSEHTVCLTRLTEPLDNSGFSVMTLSLTADGTEPILLPRPAASKRKMLFIGDSITCGYGILTNENSDCFHPKTEDGSLTYAALTARHFHADAQYVSISGRGVTDNCEHYPGPTMPRVFGMVENEGAPYDFSEFVPDVTVVALGTNDNCAEVPAEQLRAGAVAFMKDIRAQYPDTIIIWMYGMMNIESHETLANAVRDFGGDDNRVYYLPQVSAWDIPHEEGAARHPKLRAHYRFAGTLIDAVANVTDWEK